MSCRLLVVVRALLVTRAAAIMSSRSRALFQKPRATRGRQELPAHLRERLDAKKCHIAIDLVSQQFDGVTYAGLAGDRRRVEKRPPKEEELCAECERLQYVGAATHAAVHHHSHGSRFGSDARQHAQRRNGTVELPSAVIRDDDAIDA